MQLERQSGITNILCGFCSLDDAIKRNVRENLDVITAGEIPPNPAELIAADEFKETLNELKSRYEYIFIDTPPVTVVTDAAVAMKNSHGVVVVARQNMTNFDLLDMTMDDIKKADTRVFGVVVLDSNAGQKKYGYLRYGRYGKYKYGYRYGYKYGYNYKYGDDNEEDDGTN